MGLDLYLLPVDGDHLPNVFFAHQHLNLHRNQIIRDIQKVAEEHAVDIPQPLFCFVARQRDGESGYGDAIEDPYGSRLQYLLAKHLKPLGKQLGITLDDTPLKRPTAWDRVNGKKTSSKKKVTKVMRSEQVDGYQSDLSRAAFAYICALPDDFKIVLYWH
jgi:hypothetical protein